MPIKKPEQENLQSVLKPSDSPLQVIPRPAVHPPAESSVFSVGRPSKFNWLLVKEICLSMQNGNPLTTICQADNMPDYHTVAHWSKKYPKFAQMLERSRVIMADVIAEKSMTLFDEEAPMEVIKTKNGEYERISMSGVQRERYKSQSMQWLASRYNPERYGEKVSIANSFDITTVLTTINATSKKTLKKARRMQEQPIDVSPTDQSTQQKI